MKFAEPFWLIAGLIACGLLWWRFIRFDRQQHVAMRKLISPHLLDQLTRSVSPGRRRLKHALVTVGVALLCIALARPQFGYRWEEAHRKGLDIFFAVDTSKSMLTQDVKPDRLTRAKMAVSDMVDRLNGDDVGLIAFAGEAFVQSPETLDYDAFRESLNALDTSTIPRGGTDIASAIAEAQAAFKNENNHDKILVLLTDGEDLEGNAVTAAQAAAKDGVKIFTVGVGTACGELIPVPTDGGGTEFVKDDSGQFVKSHLDETMLKKIADATGGMYQPLGPRGEGLTTIYNQGLAPFARHDLAARQHRVYLERFQWPLLAAILCFLADFLVGSRKRRVRLVEPATSAGPVRVRPNGPRLAVPAAVAVLLFAVMAVPHLAKASPQSAEKAYQKGDYTTAAQEYQADAEKTPTSTELNFNAGSAAYKAGEYDKAADAFKKSLSTDHLNLQQEAYYNLGNTQFRQGQQTMKTDPKKTIPVWQQALQSYEAALQLKPDDADAKYNRDIVKQKLEKLQQQQQQKKDNKDQTDQKNQDQSKQDQNQNGQGQKSQDKQGQSGHDQKTQSGQDQKNPASQNQSGNDQKKQDQKHQDQAKQGESGSDQKQQTGQPKDQDKTDAGKDQQDKQDQQAKGNPQPNSQLPKSQKPEGSDQAKSDAGKPGSDQAASAQDVPGQMTREEARQLLDSVKSDEHQLPAAPVSRNPNNDQKTTPVKDW
jgi:Ca-activated chloride channel family protein